MPILIEGTEGTEVIEVCRECRHQIEEHHPALGCKHAAPGEAETYECVCLGFIE